MSTGVLEYSSQCNRYFPDTNVTHLFLHVLPFIMQIKMCICISKSLDFDKHTWLQTIKTGEIQKVAQPQHCPQPQILV